jgi:arsenate reductase
MQLFGIPNCDSVKKARAFLQQQAIAHEFVDFKRQPPSLAQLKDWAQHAGWDTLLNRAGSTWRQLSEAERELAVDESGALALMATHPSLIKRPLVAWAHGALTVGLPALQAEHAVQKSKGER